MKRWIGRIFLSLLFVPNLLAQESDDKVPLPDDIMRQALGRILRYNFKPRRIPTTIPIVGFITVDNSDYSFAIPIKQGWLPKIKNLTFKLVPEEELPDVDQVFVFNCLQQDKGVYLLSVGRRDKCSGEGKVWILRANSSKVRLWPSKEEQWGAVYCDKGTEEKP